jgi:hypothetical protein
MSKDVRDFRVELLALMVIVVGVFLMLDWSPILLVVDQVVVGIEQVVVGAARRLTPAMLIGTVLIIGAGVFIAWRVRVRFLNSAYWRATTCPRCGSPLHRVHRSRLEKAASKVFLLHAWRYRCERAECRWSGLRHSRRHNN